MFRRSPLHQKLRIMHGMQVCQLDEAGANNKLALEAFEAACELPAFTFAATSCYSGRPPHPQHPLFWAPHSQALRLSDAQQEQLLSLRSTHLAKLRACYQERQDLNLEVWPRASSATLSLLFVCGIPMLRLGKLPWAIQRTPRSFPQLAQLISSITGTQRAPTPYHASQPSSGCRPPHRCRPCPSCCRGRARCCSATPPWRAGWPA